MLVVVVDKTHIVVVVAVVERVVVAQGLERFEQKESIFVVAVEEVAVAVEEVAVAVEEAAVAVALVLAVIVWSWCADEYQLVVAHLGGNLVVDMTEQPTNGQRSTQTSKSDATATSSRS